MWLLIRLVLAVIGFAVRQWRRRSPPAVHGHHLGEAYYLREHRDKKRVTAVTVGMAAPSPTWVRMHVESRLDRFFKRIGAANELQTGDVAFDDRVYLTCDHPAVTELVAASPELRAAVLAALDVGATAVRYDGQTVWLDQLPGEAATDAQLDALLRVQRASAPIEHTPRRWFADPFLWKALLIEGVVWAMLGYAIGAFAEVVIHREDVHVHPGHVIATGLGVAAVALLALVAVTWLVLRGSSRGHRVLIESAVVLTLGLPVASIQVLGDTNRALDDAAAVRLTAPVDRCEVREHRGKRGSKSYTYHLWLSGRPTPDRFDLPSQIQVVHELCNAAEARREVELVIKPGRWGLPWYQELSAGGVRWAAPS